MCLSNASIRKTEKDSISVLSLEDSIGVLWIGTLVGLQGAKAMKGTATNTKSPASAVNQPRPSSAPAAVLSPSRTVTREILGRFNDVFYTTISDPNTKETEIIELKISDFHADETAPTVILRCHDITYKAALLIPNESETREILQRTSYEVFQKQILSMQIAMLRISMTTDRRVPHDFKSMVFYGLLLHRGITFVLEDGDCLAPRMETDLGSLNRCSGMLRYQTDWPSGANHVVDLTTFVHVKRQIAQDIHRLNLRCPLPTIRELIAFILFDLPRHEDQGLLPTKFRLKSYASVVNKLFYRGKSLSDLYAATATTFDELEALLRYVEEKGAYFISPTNGGDDRNGNGCHVFRFVRMLEVSINLSQGHKKIFNLPISYEIVYQTAYTRVPHDEYELRRLEFGLNDSQKKLLKDVNCVIATPTVESKTSRPTPTTIPPRTVPTSVPPRTIPTTVPPRTVPSSRPVPSSQTLTSASRIASSSFIPMQSYSLDTFSSSYYEDY